MQTTIVEQPGSIGLKEPEAIQAIRADRRIRSVTVRKGKPAKLAGAEEPAEYSITDLLEDTSYFVTSKQNLYEVVFPAKQEHVVVALEPGSDVTKIADYIANHLDLITTSN